MVKTYNGGIALGIGNYTLKCISSYSPSFIPESENFTGYDYSLYSAFKGMRFKASIQTGLLIPDDFDKLKNALFAHQFTFTSKEFTGAVLLTNISAPVKHANIYGTFYSVSFAVSAVALIGGSGGL